MKVVEITLFARQSHTSMVGQVNRFRDNSTIGIVAENLIIAFLLSPSQRFVIHFICDERIPPILLCNPQTLIMISPTRHITLSAGIIASVPAHIILSNK